MWPPPFQVFELSQVRSALETARAEHAEAQLRVAHLTAENYQLHKRVRVLEHLLSCELPREDDVPSEFCRALGEPEVRMQLKGVGSFVSR